MTRGSFSGAGDTGGLKTSSVYIGSLGQAGMKALFRFDLNCSIILNTPMITPAKNTNFLQDRFPGIKLLSGQFMQINVFIAWQYGQN